MNTLDSEERTPLMLAVLRSSWNAARALVRLGAAADIPDLGGRNLLHFLVMNSGHVEDLVSACPVSPSTDLGLVRLWHSPQTWNRQYCY